MVTQPGIGFRHVFSIDDLERKHLRMIIISTRISRPGPRYRRRRCRTVTIRSLRRPRFVGYKVPFKQLFRQFGEKVLGKSRRSADGTGRRSGLDFSFADYLLGGETTCMDGMPKYLAKPLFDQWRGSTPMSNSR
jgi:hypothetical protein